MGLDILKKRSLDFRIENSIPENWKIDEIENSAETQKEIAAIKSRIAEVETKMDKYLTELGF